MSFIEYGQFKISHSEKVLILSFFGLCNLEYSQAFFSKYKQAVKKSALERLGIFSDLSNLQEETPKAIRYFPTIIDWSQTRSQIAQTLVQNNAFEEYMVQTSIHDNKKGFRSDAFQNRKATFHWLENLGLKTSYNPVPSTPTENRPWAYSLSGQAPSPAEKISSTVCLP